MFFLGILVLLIALCAFVIYYCVTTSSFDILPHLLWMLLFFAVAFFPRLKDYVKYEKRRFERIRKEDARRRSENSPLSAEERRREEERERLAVEEEQRLEREERERRYREAWERLRQEKQRRQEEERQKQEETRQTSPPCFVDDSLYFFRDCADLDEVKSRYRQLQKIYHPDMKTGNLETAKELNRQYDLIMSRYE